MEALRSLVESRASVPVNFTGSITKPALFEAHFLAEDVSKITATIVSWDDSLQEVASLSGATHGLSKSPSLAKFGQNLVE